MTNVFRRLGNSGAVLHATACAAFFATAFLASSARAQDTVAEAKGPLQRQLDKVDLGISGAGEFSTSTNGANYLAQNVNFRPSNTVGALVTIRYIKSPRVGLELNVGYARYTENVTITNTNASPTGATPLAIGIQTNAMEYTLGYVVHTREQHYGVIPFAAIGAGTTAFRPTRGGGLGYLEQARATYYYTVGADTPLYYEHFGLRVQFHQAIYLAPDYETNYLTDLKRSIASEPTFGFFIKF